MQCGQPELSPGREFQELVSLVSALSPMGRVSHPPSPASHGWRAHPSPWETDKASDKLT